MQKVNWDKYKNNGNTGLMNLGNTCFLNSCIQVLNHTYELVDFLHSEKNQKYTKHDLADCSITKEWMELREVMWTNSGTVSPNKFVFHVHKLAKEKNREIFTGWAQNDMSEFLLFMIECMHNSISRSINMNIHGKTETDIDKLAISCYSMLKDIYKKEYSEIMDMFYGIYVSELYSLNGVRYTLKPEHFFILDLPINEDSDNCTLLDCFDVFVNEEILDGDNAWFNENTNEKEDVTKRITFWNLPKILVITLKRFSADGERKLDNMVDFPLENLDLSKYISGYNASSYVYDLFGVCNHIGSPMGGHYTSFVKNASNEWIHYNDSNVNVLHSSSQINTPMAYCLFYRKKM